MTPPPTIAPARAADHGSATIWVLTASAVVLAVTLAVTSVATAYAARQRAAAAADLAALAGATRVLGPDACATAQRVAAANGARLAACADDGTSVLVTAVADLPGALTALAPGATARARAGPAP